ncbi:recombination regulator RecX [Corynebacterium urogenitale]
MTTNSHQPANSAKIAVLKEALERMEAGELPALIDHEEEKALAPIKAKAVRLLNHRDRSAHELRSRLLDAEFDPQYVEQVVERCIANGMVDDSRFASEWVRQRQANQKKSVAVLRRELKEKGVAGAIIDEALEQISADDQNAILDQLVTKKAASVKHVPTTRAEYDKVLRRVVGVAARRGFPQGRSLTAARQALDARIAELEG